MIPRPVMTSAFVFSMDEHHVGVAELPDDLFWLQPFLGHDLPRAGKWVSRYVATRPISEGNVACVVHVGCGCAALSRGYEAADVRNVCMSQQLFSL